MTTMHARKRMLFSVLVLHCVLSLVSLAQTDIASKADELVNAFVKQKDFSGAVLVARNGTILLSKGYGMANYELNVPNTPQTKLRLGSLTKQFTAAAILQLAERGKLRLDDPLKKYLPDFQSGEKITIHHLLTHTSGIPNFTDFPDYESTMMLAVTPEQEIAKFKNKPLDFQPGEQWKYSNSGYFLLGYLVEKISGLSYGEYLKQNVFDPLGMKNSGADDSKVVLSNRASGYKLGDDHAMTNDEYMHMSIPLGAGSLYSTVEDLYLWDRALYTEKILSKGSKEKMFTAYKQNYGYGWGIASLYNRKLFAHSGGINGFTSNIMRLVDDDVCIVVLANFIPSPTAIISRSIAAIVFGQPYELPREHTVANIDSKIYQRYVGRYELAPAFSLTITVDKDRLFAQATGQSKNEIFPESETKFFLKVVEAQVEFQMDEKGKVTQLVLFQNGRQVPGKKVE